MSATLLCPLTAFLFITKNPSLIFIFASYWYFYYLLYLDSKLSHNLITFPNKHMSSQQYKKEIVKLMPYLDKFDHLHPSQALQWSQNLPWKQQKTKSLLYHHPLLKKSHLLFDVQQQQYMGWAAQLGNPTWPVPIACFIKHLKKKTSHCGTDTQARRAFV